MNIVLIIWLAVSCFTFVLWIFAGITAKQELVKKYAGVKVAKATAAQKVLSGLKFLFLCFCPILNVLSIFSCVFCYDNFKKGMEESILERIEE